MSGVLRAGPFGLGSAPSGVFNPFVDGSAGGAIPINANMQNHPSWRWRALINKFGAENISEILAPQLNQTEIVVSVGAGGDISEGPLFANVRIIFAYQAMADFDLTFEFETLPEGSDTATLINVFPSDTGFPLFEDFGGAVGGATVTCPASPEPKLMILEAASSQGGEQGFALLRITNIQPAS